MVDVTPEDKTGPRTLGPLGRELNNWRIVDTCSFTAISQAHAASKLPCHEGSGSAHWLKLESPQVVHKCRNEITATMGSARSAVRQLPARQCSPVDKAPRRRFTMAAPRPLDIHDSLPAAAARLVSCFARTRRSAIEHPPGSARCPRRTMNGIARRRSGMINPDNGAASAFHLTRRTAAGRGHR